MFGCPSTVPCGFKPRERELLDERLERHAVLQADRVPTSRKQFIKDRNAAPSLCISMKISPKAPSAYSPVRRNTL